ncbi:flagellar basal body P-ring protein FlgI [Leptolyngbya sp. 15MV]|nr:flagellar basal body P-ring protein FlgI [Leptolyngbya sp. 15MV]
MIRTIILAIAALFAAVAAPVSAERMRDLGSFQSVRSNQLTGYGIVVGLDGTGDDNFAYVTQAMRGVSDRFGLTLPPGVNPALKNAAAVIVTADLPAFAKPGQRIDITVSTIGIGHAGGGTIATEQRDERGVATTTPLFRVTVEGLATAEGDQPWRGVPGERVHLRFELPPRPLSEQWVTRLRQLIQGRVDL